MRAIAALLAIATLLAFPLGSAETEIGSGHIVFGAPTTLVAGIPEVTSLFFEAPAEGTVLTTRTLDNGDLGYDLDIYFYAEDGAYMSGCATDAMDEVCPVPAGAAEVEVAAFFGADLHVTLVAL